MARSTKFFLTLTGVILAVMLCNLTGSIVSNQTGTLASSAASIAQSQALSEQARANQQMARALQSFAHTMNLLLVVVLLLACLGAGVYIWKTKHPPSPPSLTSPERPPRVVIVRDANAIPHPALPASLHSHTMLEEGEDLLATAILDALLSGEEWQ